MVILPQSFVWKAWTYQQRSPNDLGILAVIVCNGGWALKTLLPHAFSLSAAYCRVDAIGIVRPNNPTSNEKITCPICGWSDRIALENWDYDVGVEVADMFMREQQKRGMG